MEQITKQKGMNINYDTLYIIFIYLFYIDNNSDCKNEEVIISISYKQCFKFVCLYNQIEINEYTNYISGLSIK